MARRRLWWVGHGRAGLDGSFGWSSTFLFRFDRDKSLIYQYLYLLEFLRLFFYLGVLFLPDKFDSFSSCKLV